MGDEHWRVDTHERLKESTAPLLVMVLADLERLRADPQLTESLHADARMIAISVAEASVLLDCFLETLDVPHTVRITRPPVRLEARKRFLADAEERFLGRDAAAILGSGPEPSG